MAGEVKVAGHSFPSLTWGAKCMDPCRCTGIRSLTDLVLGLESYEVNVRGVAHTGVLWDSEIEEIRQARASLMAGVERAMASDA